MTRATVFVPAYAKINLTLSALGRRADGYHELASVMQTISLHDTLRFSVGETETENDTFTCDIPELAGPDNLVARAVALLRGQAGRPLPPVDAQLHKEIPAQGGLGGGSSDAATTLATLNVLLGLGFSSERLEALAGQLGSDTPYLVTSGTARIYGRGERVEPLPDIEPLWIALVTPATPISTAALFRALTPEDYGDMAATDALVAAIRAGQPIALDALENTLELAVFRLYPEVARARDRLLALGAPVVRMSGSGPSLFAPYRSLIEAVALVRRASAAGERVWLCHTVTRAEIAATRMFSVQ
ncbi:MAG TPA: 4-(cytidine 5'-diphospho)-2-C-methyl-D-erythritol kinase [Ktedonobacterales bacterium]|nr:4-(cytidine 5'-diphospho)-2-C-methyl-D-erythritol kinase [Ktedonobacterales bacterium]